MESSWAQLAEQLLAASATVLCVGGKPVAHHAARHVASLEQLTDHHSTYQAVVWQPRGFVAGELSPLRARLEPGALLLIHLHSPVHALAFLRSLFKPGSAPLVSLHPVCEALLLHGLLAPTVYGLGKRGLAVTARRAATSSRLDAVFEQPAC